VKVGVSANSIGALYDNGGLCQHGASRVDALRYSAALNRTHSYTEIGNSLRMNEGAVKVAVHRLRKRYGELIRVQIAQTVATAAQVDEELRYLFAVVRE